MSTTILLEQFNEVKKNFETSCSYQAAMSTDIVPNFYTTLCIYQMLAQQQKDATVLQQVETEIQHHELKYGRLMTADQKKKSFEEAQNVTKNKPRAYIGYFSRSDIEHYKN